MSDDAALDAALEDMGLEEEVEQRVVLHKVAAEGAAAAAWAFSQDHRSSEREREREKGGE